MLLQTLAGRDIELDFLNSAYHPRLRFLRRRNSELQSDARLRFDASVIPIELINPSIRYSKLTADLNLMKDKLTLIARAFAQFKCLIRLFSPSLPPCLAIAQL